METLQNLGKFIIIIFCIIAEQFDFEGFNIPMAIRVVFQLKFAHLQSQLLLDIISQRLITQHNFFLSSRREQDCRREK